MNYDMNLIKYHKNVFFRIASVILIVCFTLFGFTACAGTTDRKDNKDDNALLQHRYSTQHLRTSSYR